MNQNMFCSMSNMLQSFKIREIRLKTKAEKRLRPIHGDNWEMIYLEELRKEAHIAKIQLQMCNMSSYEVAEWIYKLEKEKS